MTMRRAQLSTFYLHTFCSELTTSQKNRSTRITLPGRALETQSCQARQPFRCRVEHGAVLGDEGKAVGCRIPTALLSERVMPARRFPPPWSVEEQEVARTRRLG
jgi:hypothetical protein